jgi:cytidylate kinase
MTVYTCEPHPLTGSGNFRLDHAPTIPIEERRVSEESEIHGEGGPPHDHVTSEEGQTVGDGGEVTCGPKLACNEEVATASNIPKVNEGRSIESADPQNVIVGSRVAVWWPDDAKFYNGTVVSYRRTRKRNRFHLEYDDNEKEWIDFDSNNFQFLEGSKQRPTNKRGDEHARMVRRIQSGSRVAVYWSLDRQYYNATVRSISPGSKPHHLVYDDGEEEHVDLLSHSFLILANGGGNGNCSHSGSEGELQTAEGDRRGRGRVRRTSESSTRGTSSDGIDANANQDFGRDRADANDAKDVIVGSRVSVWWPRDRANYDATVIEFRSGKRRPYLIRYDDSDEEWIDFREHTFRFLRGSVKRPDGSRGDRHSSKVEQVRSGSRVAVWWPLERQFYSATVRSVKPAPNPHQVVYDDGDEERIDLNFHDFFIIGNGSDESRIDSVQGTRMALAPASEASVAEAENVPCSSPASKPRTGKRGIGGSKHTRSQPKTDKVRKSFRKG